MGIKSIIGASILMLVSVQVNATLIAYDFSATMYGDGSTIAQDVVGKLLIEEPTFTLENNPGGFSTGGFFTYNIPFFVISIGDYQYYGDGAFYSQVYEGFTDDDYQVVAWDTIGLSSWDGLFSFGGIATPTFSYSDGTPYETNGLRTDLLASDFFNLPYRMDGEGDTLSASINGFQGDIMGIVIQQVPEPGTWLLLGTGLLGIGIARRKKA